MNRDNALPYPVEQSIHGGYDSNLGRLVIYDEAAFRAKLKEFLRQQRELGSKRVTSVTKK